MVMASQITKAPFYSRLTSDATVAAQPSPNASSLTRLAHVTGGGAVAPLNTSLEPSAVPSHTLLAGDNGGVESIPNVPVRTPTGLAYSPGIPVGRGTA